MEELGLLEKSASLLIDAYGELDVQRHAMYCLWMMERGKVHVPPAWLTVSLEGDWNASHGMPSEWLPRELGFRVDQATFAEFAREMREEEGAS